MRAFPASAAATWDEPPIYFAAPKGEARVTSAEKRARAQAKKAKRQAHRRRLAAAPVVGDAPARKDVYDVGALDLAAVAASFGFEHPPKVSLMLKPNAKATGARESHGWGPNPRSCAHAVLGRVRLAPSRLLPPHRAARHPHPNHLQERRVRRIVLEGHAPAGRLALLAAPRGRRAAPDVLDAPGLAAPEDGAVVVAVHEALEHDDQPARPPRQHRFYPLRAPLRVVGALEALRRGLRLPQRCRDARRRREERSRNAGQCETASHPPEKLRAARVKSKPMLMDESRPSRTSGP